MELVFTIGLAILLLAVCVEDVRRYTIPNGLNLLFILLFVPYFLLMPTQGIWLHLAGFGALFALGFVLFALKLMGGGDTKLFAVLGLWCGWSMSAAYLVIYTGLLGGVLAIALVMLRKFLPYMQAKSGRVWKLPLMCIDGQPIPYGLAIAGAFAILMIRGEVL